MVFEYVKEEEDGSGKVFGRELSGGWKDESNLVFTCYCTGGDLFCDNTGPLPHG